MFQMTLKKFGILPRVVFFGLTLMGSVCAQENLPTPSQKTKDAVDKFSDAPAAIAKGLQGLTDAARAKLQQTLSRKAGPETIAESPEQGSVSKSTMPSEPSRFTEGVKRDPFRPPNLKTKSASTRENLSPLERFDLSQLKVTGIVWDIKEPRAMIEDKTGLGYIVKVGTPIGGSEGRVKAIRRDQIVVEETYEDVYGAKKKRDVGMKLSTE
jgi:Tfp pilus assembly protein PilP